MARGLEGLDRRERRLRELEKDQQYRQVNDALKRVWEDDGQRPDPVLVRPSFILSTAPEAGDRPPAPMSQLLNPRGIALRFYLLMVFEAQCRLAPGAEWTNARPLDGRGSRVGWADFIAIDAAFSTETSTYRRNTKQQRDLTSSRIKQIKGALRTLQGEEEQGPGLVEVPRKANQRRDRAYTSFALMDEAGRGELPTPHRYSVPKSSERMIGIPRDFFLHGWVHVLYPSEIATWLTLRYLRRRFPKGHGESGVFLHGQPREQDFHLKRDAYEDGCAMLQQLGLIRRVQRSTSSPDADVGADGFFVGIDLASIDLDAPPRYEPYRYQLTDEGLAKDGLEQCRKALAFQRKARLG